MSKWHYRLIKHIYPKGEVHYSVHEYYPATEERGEMWTENPVSLWGETPEGINWMLSSVEQDIGIHDLIEVEHDDYNAAQDVESLLERIQELDIKVKDLEEQLEFERSLGDWM